MCSIASSHHHHHNDNLKNFIARFWTFRWYHVATRLGMLANTRAPSMHCVVVARWWSVACGQQQSVSVEQANTSKKKKTTTRWRRPAVRHAS